MISLTAPQRSSSSTGSRGSPRFSPPSTEYPVKDKNFSERIIRVAYDPIERQFKNADASTDRDPRYISAVSEVFEANRLNKLSKFRREFIKDLNDSNLKKGLAELTDEEEDRIENGLNALLGLERYYLPTLNITVNADEEMVSDIFVRVNSQGQALKQDDFIMTLLSVYEPEMRERIERFARRAIYLRRTHHTIR